MLNQGGPLRNDDLQATHLGFARHGEAMTGDAVHIHLPSGPLDAERSVCGFKAFLIDEHRQFVDDHQQLQTVACARVALVEITDSPVHVHGQTVESYHILDGCGRMVLGDRIRSVEAGDYLLIPPGICHGLCSDRSEVPVRVLMSFTPGMAPVGYQQFRDERIVGDSASAWIARQASVGELGV